LLEALNRVPGDVPQGLYVFQSGNEDEARALWSQKGVRAIAYPADNHHAGLWNTLGAWAARARDPEGWRKKLIRRSMKGPEGLAAHERGQVVHLASIQEGARAIGRSSPPLPGTWLCVFDPATRYAAPGKADPMRADDPELDPFLNFGIDTDPAPPPADPRVPYNRRENAIRSCRRIRAKTDRS
jgi:hypothetical protein